MAEAALRQKPQDAEEKPNKSKAAVADYLAAPRRKRKNFLLIATGENFDSDLEKSIVGHFKAQYPKFATASPKSRDDFLRQFTRNISLVVIDDQFLELEQSLELIKLLKERKRDTKVPVLFLTQQPEKLAHLYQKILPDYHDHDDFLQIDRSSRAQIFHAIKTGVEAQFSRKWKRYKVEIPVTIHILDSDKLHAGRLVDFSTHGALLESADGYVFSLKDQLRLHLDVESILQDQKHGVLRLTAKVKRLEISGTRAGVSWEFMAEEKKLVLSRIMSSLMEKYLSKQARIIKAKLAKVPIPTGR